MQCIPGSNQPMQYGDKKDLFTPIPWWKDLLGKPDSRKVMDSHGALCMRLLALSVPCHHGLLMWPFLVLDCRTPRLRDILLSAWYVRHLEQFLEKGEPLGYDCESRQVAFDIADLSFLLRISFLSS